MFRRVSLALAFVSFMFPFALDGISGQIATPIPTIVRDPSSQPRVQQVPIGTGQIEGIITAAASSRPLPNTLVVLSGLSTVPAARGARGRGPNGLTPDTPIRGGVVAPPETAPMMSLSRTTGTDAQGRFVFDRLPAGRFNLTANRNQFLTTNYGQKKPGRPGSPIQLMDGQRVSVSLSMIRSSVISGTVTGDDGEPAPQAQVLVYRHTLTNGFKRLVSAGGGSTDDRGMYRIFGLQPGDYIVAATPNPSALSQIERAAADRAALLAAVAAATPRPGDTTPVSTVSITLPPPGNPDGASPSYAPTYFPGTPMLGTAATVAVGPGEERGSVDMSAQLVRAVNVRGTVSIPAGLAAAVQISLTNDDPTLGGMRLDVARAGADGAFVLRSVPPGQYSVLAQTVPQPRAPVVVNGVITGPPQPPRQIQDSDRLWGRAPVTVDGQSASDVSIQLQRGRSISGQVVFETTTPVDLTRTRVMVTLAPAPSAEQIVMANQSPQAQVGLDGRFTLAGVVPGRYFVRAQGVMKSAIVNGQDTLDFPLEITGREDVANVIITVTDRVSELAGRLTEATGQPGSDYTIIIAPDDRRYWTPGSRRILTTRPGIDGAYVLRGLPPGIYHLAALTDMEPGGQFDPEFLRALTGASTRVTILEGTKQVQDLRVVR